MSRKPLFWFVLVALALVLPVLAGEAVARIAGLRPFQIERAGYTSWAKPDLELGWLNNTGTHPTHEAGHATMTILSDGSRATQASGPVAYPKLLVVGCSFSQGYGVHDDESFAWLLNRSTPTANFAVSGYGTYQALLMLERLYQRGLRPEWVVYGFHSLHAQRNVAVFSHVQAMRAFGGERFSPPHIEFRNGDFRPMPPLRIRDWPGESSSALVTLLHNSLLGAAMRDRDAMMETVTKELLRRMNRLVEDHGGKLLVVMLWDQYPGSKEYIKFLQGGGFHFANCMYPGVLDAAKIQVGGNGHPNQIVHAWWAKCIGEAIARSAPHRP